MAKKDGAIAAADKVAEVLTSEGIVVILTALDALEFYLPNNISEVQKNTMINRIIKPFDDKIFGIKKENVEDIEPNELIDEINKRYKAQEEKQNI